MKKRAHYKFELYTAAETQNSAAALSNLLAICKAYLPDDYEIEVIDVFRHPKRALAHSIRMTPTLVKTSPHPRRTIVGTLNQTQRVLVALGIEAAPEPTLAIA